MKGFCSVFWCTLYTLDNWRLTHSVYHRTPVFNELTRMWDSVIVTQVERLLRIFFGGTEEMKTNFSLHRCSLSWGLNLWPPEYGTGVLPHLVTAFGRVGDLKEINENYQKRNVLGRATAVKLQPDWKRRITRLSSRMWNVIPITSNTKSLTSDCQHVLAFCLRVMR